MSFKLLSVFQYISCYCLSSFVISPTSYRLYFNTSHVTVYLSMFAFSHEKQSNFNTSHVTVYQSIKGNCRTIWTISIHLMLLFIFVLSLLMHNLCWFQYISCYCLSKLYLCLVLQSKQFQYISCYCLSGNAFILSRIWLNFNTSHVTVYRVVLLHYYINI